MSPPVAAPVTGQWLTFLADRDQCPPISVLAPDINDADIRNLLASVAMIPWFRTSTTS